jgi:ribosomal-protein-alanine N-acetyltransferase
VSQPGPSTARFSLAPLQPSDRGDLFAHFSDLATVEFMDIAPMTTIAEADETIAWARRLLDAGEGVRWAIRNQAGGFVGTIGFNSLVRERGSRGEIGYDVVRPLWRQGVMGEVLPAVLDHAFETLGLHRVEAMITPGNAASVGLLTAHGFRLEGLLRDHGHWRGRFWDQQLFARLSTDRL